jgi:hypothetical protein
MPRGIDSVESRLELELAKARRSLRLNNPEHPNRAKYARIIKGINQKLSSIQSIKKMATPGAVDYGPLVKEKFEARAKSLKVPIDSLMQAYAAKYGVDWKERNLDNFVLDEDVIQALQPYEIDVMKPTSDRGRSRTRRSRSTAAYLPTETTRDFESGSGVGAPASRRGVMFTDEGGSGGVSAAAPRRRSLSPAESVRSMGSDAESVGSMASDTSEENIGRLRRREAAENASVERSRANLISRGVDKDSFAQHFEKVGRAQSLGAQKRGLIESRATNRILTETNRQRRQYADAARSSFAKRKALAERDTFLPGYAHTEAGKPTWHSGPRGLQRHNIEETIALASLPYEPFPRAKVVNPNALQVQVRELAGLEIGREGANISEYTAARDKLEKASASTGYETEAASMQGAKAPSTEGIKSYMDPFMENVLDRLKKRSLRDFNEKLVPHMNRNLGMSGGLNAGRKTLMQQGYRDLQESWDDQEAKLSSQGYGQALGASSADKERLMNASRFSGGLYEAGRQRQEQAARNLHDMTIAEQGRRHGQITAISIIGQQDQAMAQAARDSEVAEHDAERKHALSMASVKSAVLNNAQLPTHATQSIQTPPTVTQSPLTTMGNIMGTLAMAKSGRTPTVVYKGGRIKRAGGGLMPNMDPMAQQAPEQEQQEVDPLMRGASNARRMLDKYRTRMTKTADKLDSPGSDPMYSMLGRMFAEAAASKNPYPLQALGEGMPKAMDAYEAQDTENQNREIRANAIHKSIVDTYMIEEETRTKRALEKEEMALKKLGANSTAGVHAAHARYYDTLAAQTASETPRTITVGASSSGTGNPVESTAAKTASETPRTIAVGASSSGTGNPVESTETIQVMPITKDRRERIDALKDSLEQSEQGLQVANKMHKTAKEGSLGYTGPGGTVLNAHAATGLGTKGNIAKHTNFFKDTKNLALHKMKSMREIRMNMMLERMVSQTKPEENDSIESILMNTADHIDFFKRASVIQKAEIEMLSNGVPPLIIEKAMSAWKKDNPPSEDSVLREIKSDPTDYLPNLWQMQIGVPKASTKPTSSSNSSSVEQEKAALIADNARMRTRLGK